MEPQRQLTQAQKIEITKIVKRMALEGLAINMFLLFFLMLVCVLTTAVGTILHSTLFCVITGFLNFIFYYKMANNVSKTQREKYGKKFKEVLGK